MSRRPATFTVADLNRATKVAERYGREVLIDRDGRIRLVRPVQNPPRSPSDPDDDGEELVF